MYRFKFKKVKIALFNLFLSLFISIIQCKILIIKFAKKL